LRILLDTRLLLWSLGTPSKLSKTALRRIDAAEAFASAASIWEIGIKAALGKLEADPEEVLNALAPAGYRLLPISGEHAVAAAKLPPIHRDPFDRMLIAQALIEPMTLLTNDDLLERYGGFIEIV
jgi:PIN domain nuclease of toxin-antitoxin system